MHKIFFFYYIDVCQAVILHRASLSIVLLSTHVKVEHTNVQLSFPASRLFHFRHQVHKVVAARGDGLDTKGGNLWTYTTLGCECIEYTYSLVWEVCRFICVFFVTISPQKKEVPCPPLIRVGLGFFQVNMSLKNLLSINNPHSINCIVLPKHVCVSPHPENVMIHPHGTVLFK
jgi:hypothetical protein